MRRAVRRSRRAPQRESWEHKLLALLAYPANLAMIGVAATVLSLAVVTVLPASIAAARSIQRWQMDGDDAVFTGTFREFALTWRRTLPLGIAATVIGIIAAGNVVFLWGRLAGGGEGIAVALLAASVPVTLAILLLSLALPVAAVRSPDAAWRTWLVESAALIASRPLGAAVLLLIVAALISTFVMLPTLAPFFGLSLPAFLALSTFRHVPQR